MLTCIFVGRKSSFNHILAGWLARRTRLLAIVWADQGRYTWPWRLRWLRRSLKRCGLIGTIDRVLFRIWAVRSKEMRRGYKAMLGAVSAACCVDEATDHVESIFASSVNAPEVEARLRHLKPDIIIVNCISELISKRICELPKLGTYIFHEGLTPEYRGVHTVFWALANGDDDKVGYTFLRADNRFDAGPAYAQGQTSLDPLASSMGYVGHWALFEGLGDVQLVLRELEAGTAKAIDTSGRQDAYYSYFPFSRLFCICRRRRRRGLSVGPTTVTQRSNPPVKATASFPTPWAGPSPKAKTERPPTRMPAARERSMR
jgi:hypothetical protein